MCVYIYINNATYLKYFISNNYVTFINWLTVIYKIKIN